MNKKTQISFWLGTEAELIKVFPIMHELEKKHILFDVIATGQNPIVNSPILNTLEKSPKITILSSGPKKKSSLGLLIWFFETLINSLFQQPSADNQIMIIHGDTVSTMMGAIFGWLKSYQMAHVEAGLRSFNYLKPFPEEIDRVISSLFVDLHYAPNAESLKNLESRGGKKINTYLNTLFDSLQFFKNTKQKNDSPVEKYFVFVLHRQENLFDNEFVKNMIQLISQKSKDISCKFILHEPTKNKLIELGLLEGITNNPQIQTYPRLHYFDFMSLLTHAEFLISDGGSNQEESYYLGLPCLILRTETERTEGLGINVLLERKNFTKIESFFSEYKKYEKSEITETKRPSKIIADSLEVELAKYTV